MDNLKKAIGDLISRLRAEKGIPSQNRLSELVGVAQSTIREIELGNASPNVETLSKICEVFDMSLAEFFIEVTGGLDNKVVIDGLTPENQANIRAVANAMKNTQKHPGSNLAGSTSLTPCDKNGSKLHFKKGIVEKERAKKKKKGSDGIS